MQMGVLDQLEGFVRKGDKDLVCKFNKALYKFKQLLRVWYYRIDSFFIK